MPNWCYNNVDITATTDEQKALLETVSKAKTADGFFEMLRPLGEWEYEKCLANWGTKWDVDPLDVEFDGTTLTAGFDSAWSPPIELYDFLVEQGFEVDASYYEPGLDFGGFYSEGDNTEISDVSDLAREDEEAWSEEFRELDAIYGIAEDIAMWDEE